MGYNDEIAPVKGPNQKIVSHGLRRRLYSDQLDILLTGVHQQKLVSLASKRRKQASTMGITMFYLNFLFASSSTREDWTPQKGDLKFGMWMDVATHLSITWQTAQGLGFGKLHLESRLVIVWSYGYYDESESMVNDGYGYDGSNQTNPVLLDEYEIPWNTPETWDPNSRTIHFTNASRWRVYFICLGEKGLPQWTSNLIPGSPHYTIHLSENPWILINGHCHLPSWEHKYRGSYTMDFPANEKLGVATGIQRPPPNSLPKW